MGLFELSSWGGEETKGKDGKKLFQKRKKRQDKKKSNISKKQKKSELTKTKTESSSVNKTQESPKREQKVRKKKVKKNLPQNTLTNSPRNEKKLKIKRILPKKRFSKQSTVNDLIPVEEPELKEKSQVTKLKNQKKALKRKQKLQKKKLQNKLNSDEKTNLEPAIIASNSKKRKQSELEQTTPTKKRKKSKKGKNVTDNLGKSQNNSCEGGDNELDLRMNINKLKGMLMKKQEEKKKRKLGTSPSSLRERMLAQLRSSRFRFMNETLYNNASFETKKYFKDDPEAFAAYHEGYKQQVAHWPLNPLDTIISCIQKMPKDYIIADFGCGEAKLSQSVSQIVHSFDYIAMNDKVKACDMAHTPLLKNGVNVVVFCLSLMGTNLADYLLEANRVLKKGGIMKIAEVESRFHNIEDFVNLVSSYGFVNTWTDFSNELFYFLDFRKEKEIEKGKKKLPAIELKPCLYKKR